MNLINFRVVAATLLALVCGAPVLAAESSVWETLNKEERLKTFVNAIEKAGLADELKSTHSWTVFAPDNDAFKKLTDFNSIMDDKTKIVSLVKSHIVENQKLGWKDFKADTDCQTMGGEKFKAEPDQRKVGGMKVTQPDISASNGMIHIIDGVLYTASKNSRAESQLPVDVKSSFDQWFTGAWLTPWVHKDWIWQADRKPLLASKTSDDNAVATSSENLSR